MLAWHAQMEGPHVTITYIDIHFGSTNFKLNTFFRTVSKISMPVLRIILYFPFNVPDRHHLLNIFATCHQITLVQMEFLF